MDSGFTHLNSDGHAHMVDVTDKEITTRSAIAHGRVSISPEVLNRLHAGDMPKGDVLAVARVAAIAATKRTGDLIPLCHPLSIHAVEVSIELDDQGAHLTVEVKTADRTGVEMEALTAVSVGALTVIDMVKGLDRHARIEFVELLEKKGGRSGHWVRNP